MSLDPAKDSYSWLLPRSLTNASITHVAGDGTVGPGLAESFGYVGSGNTEFELKLRDDAKFSDGTPVTAKAVKTWLDYFAKGTSASLALLKLKSVEAVDERIVRLGLAEPNADVPYLLSEMKNWGSVSSPGSVEDPSTLQTGTYGAGPYVLDSDETSANSTYTLVPNEHYWDKSAIRYDKVVVNIIASNSSRYQAISAGQADVAQGSSDTVDAARSSGLEIVTAKNDISGFWIADWNGKTNPALSDVRVRQALNLAIDRDAITQAVAPELGAATSQPFSADGYSQDYVDHYPYDPDKARSLLQDSGHANLTLNALTCVCLGGSDEVAQAVAGYFEKIGVKLEVESAPTVSAYVSKRRTLKYSLVVYTIGGAKTAVLYSQGFDPASPLNVFGTDDPQLDDLYKEASTSSDPEPVWRRLTQRITEQAYTIPVFENSSVYYVNDKVAGVEMGDARPVPLATEWSPS